MIAIYTDGGNNCFTNKKGTWAFIVVKNNNIIHEEWGNVENSTNSIVELIALRNALFYAKDIKEDIVIRCDSEYIVKGYNIWSFNWVKKNWVRIKNKPVAHSEIWKDIISVRQPNIKVEWVKGHDSDEWNNYVDRLTHIGR